MTKYMNDIKITWPLFFLSAGLAFIFGFFLMWVMQYCVKLLIWVQIILIQVMLILAGGFFFKKADDLKKLDPQSSSHTTFLVLSIALFIFAALYFMLVCCIFKKIRLCAEILEQSADFLTDVPRITLVPILTFFITVCFFAFWVTSTLYVHT